MIRARVVFIDDFPTGRARQVCSRQPRECNELPTQSTPLYSLPAASSSTGIRIDDASLAGVERDRTEPVVSAHPDDLDKMGKSRAARSRSRPEEEVVALARADRGMRPGEVFIPFCYHEAAANLLTNAALDPVGKIAEVKYCAVRVCAD